ncbi:hypothetical protein Glove_276g33 [Diversispora epigaea]|uniref:Uncharacterized protein n=1 Tax=Diversispora epigaea TaxID=1348612 RepID=A0A397I9W9_9GLOM|nr:hypothetical protein Glove_276g33 [Diversispora epigaea]
MLLNETNILQLHEYKSGTKIIIIQIICASIIPIYGHVHFIDSDNYTDIDISSGKGDILNQRIYLDLEIYLQISLYLDGNSFSVLSKSNHHIAVLMQYNVNLEQPALNGFNHRTEKKIEQL